jgi:hypothetical protein
MLRLLASRLSYANVMSTIAVFVALGGGAYAAFKLPSNSVGTKQIKNGAVSSRKLARGAVTASKVAKGSLTGTQIRSSTLGTVPSATHATSADSATNSVNAAHAAASDSAASAQGIAAPEAFHEVGAPGEPGFLNGWSAVKDVFDYPLGFYKDREGVVHFRGAAVGGEPNIKIFELPAGYRPATGKFPTLATACECSLGAQTANVSISGTDGGVTLNNSSLTGMKRLWLDGVTFRAES